MDWGRCGRRGKRSEAIQRHGRGAGFYSSGNTPGRALGSVVKSAVDPYCGSGDALLIHDEFTPAGIETGAQSIVPAGIHPSKHRVPTPQQGHLRELHLAEDVSIAAAAGRTEEHLTQLESGTPVAVCQEAEVANLDEAWWQDM